MLPTRAYATLNLRWNPFSEPNQEERADLAVQMPKFSLEPKKAILILGEKGRGKTTHLLALHQKNLDAPYLHLPEFGKHPSIPPTELIFLDEAQRLPRLTRRLIWQRAKTWVIASHENHSRELEQAGFKVEILHLTGLTLEKLEAVIEKRLEWARRSDLEPPRIPQQKLEQLLKQFGDDLRSIEGALYDEYQKLSKESL
ncbi:MAG: hypothetical protein RLZZ156_1219 [Deinococcota bacterium]